MTPPDDAERRRLLQDLSVLFVDDEELVRMQVTNALKDAVKTLHVAPGGQEGLFSFALNRPDVVVLDVNMPGMSGIEMARAMRDISPDTTLVVVTALDDLSVFRQAIALGVSDYLAKPLEPGPLLDTLARAADTLHLKRELSRQRSLNELMLDAAPSPSVLVDLATGRVEARNQLAAELGYAPGEVCAGEVLPPILDELRRGGEALIAAQSPREICARGRHLVLHWAPVGSGLILFTSVDITHRVKMEQFRDDVERIARHDLKTPLSAFTTVPDLLLEDDNLTAEQRGFIELIRDAGTRMLGMINLSLDLFKMETGTYVLPQARFGFAALVRKAAHSARALERSLGVAVRLEETPCAEPAQVQGDELLCLSLLGNLLKNAQEASPRGAQVQVLAEDGPRPLARITNRGEVPHAIRARFFEKYVTSGKSGGTGLGTYSARMVARAHGGDVLLDASQPGQTTVTLLLPRADA